MKGLAIVLLLMVPCFAISQSVFTNQTHTALQKVIADFPQNFKNIKGELISEDPQSSDYGSAVEIPGSLNTVITRYSPDDDKEIYSWKAVLSESEEFEEASAKYASLFNQIKNSIIKIEGEKPFILSGSYQIPTEEKKFSATSFSLLPAIGELRKLKVELVLQHYITNWKVALLVYEDQEEHVVMDLP